MGFYVTVHIYEPFAWVPPISIPTITPAPQTPQIGPDTKEPEQLPGSGNGPHICI